MLFIDEIHRLNANVEEVLYPAMEDFALDIIIGKGPSARSIRLDLPRFTLIGATTRMGLLTSPLRDRFGIKEQLAMYESEALKEIILRSADILKIDITEDGAVEIGSRARGTPRVANRLLRRVRDYAEVRMSGKIDFAAAQEGLDMLGVDELGLDEVDRKMLHTMIVKFGGRAVGLDTIAAATGEDATTIEDVYEPYLLRLGFIARTPRGRIVMPAGYAHLGYQADTQQLKLEVEE
ncbi:Holliday junction ATP-dependent DNA helicase RuvB [bioreactor metagenome]|uniref:Holliday junction ATP-dependent DNA helicase RuvB n=1 Tax=bioreactor metagenome TaxID=1076179 RepID=A0A645FKG9_9ZZZZ